MGVLKSQWKFLFSRLAIKRKLGLHQMNYPFSMSWFLITCRRFLLVCWCFYKMQLPATSLQFTYWRSVFISWLSLSLDMAKGSLLYSCGFQNTWVISMVFFIAESGVLAGPSLFGTNLLWCCCTDLQWRGQYMWTLPISWACYCQQQHEVKEGSWKGGFQM